MPKVRVYLTGFTLIETLVAITVMTLAILAPFEAVRHVVSASRISKNELIASSLAQEGLEYVRFIRTNNYLAHQSDFVSGNHQLDGLDGSPNCVLPNKCTIDAVVAPSSAVAFCSGGGCSPLHQSNPEGFYTQQNIGVVTPFTRSVSVVQHSGYETVTVSVTWTDHSAQSVVLTQNLYDWL